jgi:hypothetical protein
MLVAREVGKFMLKGKAQPIVHLLGRPENVDEKHKKSAEQFADALGAFRRQTWDEAKEKFHLAIANSENDGPAQF